VYVEPYIAIPLWAFAAFGLICFARHVLRSITTSRHKKAYALIIAAKNREDTIEGVVRDFLSSVETDALRDEFLKVILLDYGSTDETPKIMDRLSYSYPVVKVLRPEEAEGYLKGMLHTYDSTGTG